MNIDARLLFEAYLQSKQQLNECWSKVQQKAYDTLVKDGYKEVKKDDSSKKITLAKKLDGTEKMITLDVDGNEHIHYGNEDSEARAGEVDWHHKVNPTDHVEHGRRAAKWELQSGKKAYNPHPEGSQDAQDWDYGYHEELKIKKTEEDAEETGLDADEVKPYTDATAEIKRVASKVVHCIIDKKTDTTFNKEMTSSVTANPEKAHFTIYDDETEKTYKVTVELAHSNEGEEVTEKVKGITKKQQALAGAVCNKQIGKHKGNAAKTAKFKRCMKGVEMSEVKYGYKPKKNK